MSISVLYRKSLLKRFLVIGGFTRRTGIGGTQRFVWVMGRPITSTVNSLMTNLTQVDQKSSDQHQKASYLRRKRDSSDGNKIYEYLKQKTPFNEKKPMLRHIVLVYHP